MNNLDSYVIASLRHNTQATYPYKPKENSNVDKPLIISSQFAHQEIEVTRV